MHRAVQGRYVLGGALFGGKTMGVAEGAVGILAVIVSLITLNFWMRLRATMLVQGSINRNNVLVLAVSVILTIAAANLWWLFMFLRKGG